MRAVRWGDNDRYFGPFTFSFSDHYRTFAICLRSSDDEGRKATFRISVGRFSFISVVPKWLVRPERKKVYAKYWSPDDIKRLGRDWYWSITPREYGIRITDGHLNIEYGRVTHDSSTEQRWGYFLPWTQWRHVRHSYYDLEGNHFADQVERWHSSGLNGRPTYEDFKRIEESVPTQRFVFWDFDGEALVVTTRIEEREWRFGTGWFKWLSLFRRAKISRYLNLTFSGETGREKGSWKGGTIGTSIEMLPGELHEAAFKRYCEQEHRSKSGPYRITFIGRGW